MAQPAVALDLSRVRALLFDVDGTLSDTDNHITQRLEGWLKPVRWLFKQGETRPFARRMVMASASPANFLYSLVDRVGLDRHLAHLFDRAAHLKAEPRQPGDLFMLIPGVREMLQALHGIYPMAVVSARPERTTRLFLSHFALDGFFETVVTAQTCRHTKPFPDPVLHAAKTLGYRPQDCLMIGDTTVDVYAALAAGAQSLSVLCGFGSEKSLRRAGTQAVLASTDQVNQLLMQPSAEIA